MHSILFGRVVGFTGMIVAVFGMWLYPQMLVPKTPWRLFLRSMLFIVVGISLSAFALKHWGPIF